MIIYQNTVRRSIPAIKINDGQNAGITVTNEGIDVFDGPECIKVDTNPFTAIPSIDAEIPGPSSSNPFKCYLENENDISDDCEGAVGGQTAFEEVTLNKGN